MIVDKALSCLYFSCLCKRRFSDKVTQEASRFYFYIKRSAILREYFREVNFPREFPLIKRQFLLFLKETDARLLVIYLGECLVTELLAARIFSNENAQLESILVLTKVRRCWVNQISALFQNFLCLRDLSYHVKPPSLFLRIPFNIFAVNMNALNKIKHKILINIKMTNLKSPQFKRKKIITKL